MWFFWHVLGLAAGHIGSDLRTGDSGTAWWTCVFHQAATEPESVHMAAGRVLIVQEWKSSWGPPLRLAQCPFYHIVSAKTSHKASSDSKGSMTDSIIPALKGKGGKVTFSKAWIQRGVASYRHFCNLPHPVFEWKGLVRERKMNQKGNKKKSPIYVLTVVGKDT